jgi:UDP-N-acetylglucosamine 2-epimerase (non-hydrolysing)
MKILHIVGARPNFMKVAPILREMQPYPQFQNILVHTGQHYDENMSKVFFDDLKLPRPDINLEVGSGSQAQQTAEVMQRFEPVVLEHKPDLVLVVGDVNSTLATTLVASKLNVPVAHVEAGLRSYDRTMPEEINRIVTDVLSDYLFTPTEGAAQILREEGIAEEKIFFTGNVMVDSLLQAVEVVQKRETWKKWNLVRGNYAVVTLHRPSNVDNPATLSQIMQGICEVSRFLPVFFPIHPRTALRLVEAGLESQIKESQGLVLAEPQGYLDFMCLMAGARLVITDSGSIQDETTTLGIPCLTLRWNTERPVTIEQGTNKLVGTDPVKILAETERILNGKLREPHRPKYWDGQAAKRIVEVLRGI